MARPPLWLSIERAALRNDWSRDNTSAGSAGLVIIFERRRERLEIHFGAVSRRRGIPFLLARYRSGPDATLVLLREPEAVLKILEGPTGRHA